jgi:hypothetical protein
VVLGEPGFDLGERGRRDRFGGSTGRKSFTVVLSGINSIKETGRHGAGQTHHQFSMSGFWLYREPSLPVRITDFITYGPKVIYDRLAVPEDGFENLSLMCPR